MINKGRYWVISEEWGDGSKDNDERDMQNSWNGKTIFRVDTMGEKLP